LPKLQPVSQRELIRRLRALGFDGPHSGAKHPFMARGNVLVTITNPHGVDLGVGLVARILRQAGISREEWLSTEVAPCTYILCSAPGCKPYRPERSETNCLTGTTASLGGACEDAEPVESRSKLSEALKGRQKHTIVQSFCRPLRGLSRKNARIHQLPLVARSGCPLRGLDGNGLRPIRHPQARRCG